jgi:RNA polymerase sigma factor FliA
MTMDAQAAHAPLAAEPGPSPDGRLDRAALEALVAHHAPLVRHIAYQVGRRLPPGIDMNDLVQSGMVGLLEAARRYHGRCGSSFSTFASYRVRGAILDSLRKTQWLSRSAARTKRRIDDATADMAASSGGASNAARIARHLHIPIEEYHRTLRDAIESKHLSLDESASRLASARMEPADVTPGPDEQLELEQLMRALEAAIIALPEGERKILSLYYDDDLLMREIGARLALSESRICQIHKRTLGHLRDTVRRGH